jgi:DNA-binding Lrp family transcriptional regulator
MNFHKIFIFVRIQGNTPEFVGDALRDTIPEIEDIYSIMGEYDLLISIKLPDFNKIQSFVTNKIRSNPHVAQTHTILGYQMHGKNWTV